MGVQSAVYEIIHESLNQEDALLTVSDLCDIAGVSRSGYYRWVSTSENRERREEADRADFALILQAYNFRGYKKGVRSINMRLLHMGIVMNPKKIHRLMRKYHLFCPIRKANPQRQMAAALRTSNVAANLLNREFEAHGARAVLLTDITYIRFMGGFLKMYPVKWTRENKPNPKRGHEQAKLHRETAMPVSLRLLFDINIIIGTDFPQEYQAFLEEMWTLPVRGDILNLL